MISAWRSRHVLLALILCAGSVLAVDLMDVEAVEREVTPPLVLEAIDSARAGVDSAADRSAAERAAAFGRLGDVLFAHGFSVQARQAYLNARTLAPTVPDWHYLLGLVAIDAGRLDDAVEHLSRAVELNPFEPAARIRRGQIGIDQGLAGQAAEDFERALALAPGAPAALAGLGRVALQAGDHERAADLFQQALKISPEATRLHQPLAMAYRGMGRLDLAREHLGRVGDGIEPVEDVLLQRVQSQSRSPQFYLEMALARAAAEDLDGARQLLVTALQLAPEDPVIVENYGEVVARQGDLEEARAAFQRLTELSPASPEAFFLLGQVEELRARADLAADVYRQVLELDPDHLPTAEALAFLKLAAGDFVAAQARFAALANRPDQQRQSRFAYWEALAMLGAGDCARGEAALESLRQRFPNDGDVLLALARVRASCGTADAEALAEALEWAEAVYQLAPTTDHAAGLAMVHAALGQLDDAVDLQAQAMFEALKLGELEQRADLRADMQSYQQQRRAEMPFSPGYPGFPPPQA